MLTEQATLELSQRVTFMVHLRRKITSRVQTVIDEVLHTMRRDVIDSSGNCVSPVVQLTRLEERVLMSATPVMVVAEAAGALSQSDMEALSDLGKNTNDAQTADVPASDFGESSKSAFDAPSSDVANEMSNTATFEDITDPNAQNIDDILEATPNSITDPLETYTISLEQQDTVIELSSPVYSGQFEASPSQILNDSTTQDSSSASGSFSLIEQALGDTYTSGRSSLQTGPELIVIDSRVNDADTLLAQLLSDGRNVQLLRLDIDEDGLQQITNKLQRIGTVSAIHLLTHGSDGEILLGATRLNAETLAQHATELLSWQQSLTANADLLLYGCNVVESPEGRNFVEALSILTGADTAASNDNTGHVMFGGDWILEYSTGAIEADIAFSTDVQQNWLGLLNVTIDGTASTTTAAMGASSAVVSHTTSGINRAMLVGISFGEDKGQSVSSVSYGGQNLTLVGVRDHSSDSVKSRVEIWGLVAPNIGTNNVVVNFSGTGHEGATIGVMTFNNVDQLQAWGTFAGNDGTSNSPSVNVQSAPNELVFGVVAMTESANQTFTSGPGQTQHWDLFQNKANGAGTTEVGATSVTTSWSTSPGADLWVAAGVSVKKLSAVVDTTADYAVGHANWGNTTSIETLIANKGADNLISLREALEAARNTTGVDTINFNIAGGGPHTISLLSALPNINHNVIINGWSEPSYAGTPVIVLDGSSIAGDGLHFVSGSAGSIVRGLVINGFGDDAIEINNTSNITVHGNYLGTNASGTASVTNAGGGINIVNAGSNTIGGTTAAERNVISGNLFGLVNISGAGSTNNVVQGNYIGLNATGTATLTGNGYNGVWIASGASNNTIGGTSAGAGNVIAGMDEEGIEVDGNTTTGNVIQGNYIGLNAAGTMALGNGSHGIALENAVGTIIGGTVAGAGNLIGGNTGAGILIAGSSATNNTIQGNSIGTDAAGTRNLANSGAGIEFANSFEAATGGSDGNLVGGTTAGAGNKLAFNTGDGIRVSSATAVDNTFLRNLIYSNTEQGIDLGPNGITANDTGVQDIDPGANNLQNYPTISSAVASSDGSSVEITFSLDSEASRIYRIEFFQNQNSEPNGEGLRYLGSTSVTTDGSGRVTNQIVTISGYGGTLLNLDYITATATRDDAGTLKSTSEFGGNRIVQFRPGISIGGTRNFVEDAGPIFLDTTVTITDPDSPHFNGGSLTVDIDDANGTADDRLIINDEGSGIGKIHITSGNRLHYDGSGSHFATFTGGTSDSDPLVISFVNTLATHAAVDRLIENIQFNNVSNTPSTAQRNVTFVQNDGVHNSVTGSVNVNVSKTNDAPTGSVTVSGTATENQTLSVSNTLNDLDGIGTVTYQWQRNGSNILGATGSTYTLGDADVGQNIRVRARYTDGEGTLETVFSNTVGPIVTFFAEAVWLSTGDDVTGGGTPGITSWGKDTLLQVAGPGFSLEPGTTSGSFGAAFDLVNNFGAEIDVELTGLHVVSRAIVVGAPGNTVNLQEGDVLFTVNGAQPTLTSTNSVTMNKSDVVRFRPDTPGDYTVGTFEIVLDDPLLGDTNIGGISLVEKNMTIGGQAVTAGNFLLVETKGTDNIVHYFDVTSAGDTTTTGTPTLLINGADIGIGTSDFTSVHLVTDTITVGGANLTQGQILVSLNGTIATGFAGMAGSVGPQDVVALTVTTAGPGTVATGSLLFEGADINLDTAEEAIEAFSLASVTSNPPANTSPTITSDGGGATAVVNVAENSTAVTTVTATDADLPAQTLTYSISGGADQAKFAINSTTGVLTFVSAPDFEVPTDAGANNVYDVIVQVSDGAGGIETQEIAVTVTNVGVQAYESFNYGAGSLEGANSGSGWATGWTTTQGSTAVVSTTGLNSPTGTLQVNAGSAEMNTSTQFNQHRNLGTAIGADGTTVWVSFLLKVDTLFGGMSLILSDGAGTANTVSIGTNSNDFLITRDLSPFGASYINNAVVDGTTYFLTARLDFQAGNDIVTLYVNPTPGLVNPDSPGSLVAQLTTADLGTFTQIGLTGGFTGNNSSIDEIRIGESFRDVAPAIANTSPVISTNGGGSTAVINVAENSTAVTTVAANDSDLPAQTLTYSISGGADQTKFAINPTTGVLTFVAPPNFEVATDAGFNNVYEVTVQVSDGFAADTQAISVTVTDVAVEVTGELWFSTIGSGAAMGESWMNTEIVRFGDAGDTFDLSGGSTNGTFSRLPGFVAPAKIRALHFVESNVRIGLSPNHFDVQRGDLVMTLDPGAAPATVTLNLGDGNSGNDIVAERQDIVVYRPNVVGDYSVGEYFMLLDSKVTAGATILNVHGLSLVEIDTTVGGTTLNAGTLLVAHSNPGHQNIATLSITGTGVNSSANSIENFLNGADLGNSGNQIQGIHLLQQDTAFSGIPLSAGTVLVQVNAAGTYAGVTHQAFDVIALTVTQTEQDTVPGTAATGVLLFDGSDIQLADGTNEPLNGFTIVSSSFPTVNQVPVAHAGGPYVINEGDSLNLNGSVSSDPDSNPLTYAWDLDNDGTFGEAGEPTTVTPSVSWATLQSFGINDNGSYTIGLRVSDGLGGIDTATTSLTVSNVAPTITSSLTPSVAETTTAVQTVTASDPVDSVAYTITGGADQARFNINAATGELTFVTAPDFEAPTDADGNNVYEVEVTANDGDGGTDVKLIAVTVTDVGGPLIVDTTLDVVDGNTSSIETLLASRGIDGKISLREAIMAANNTLGAQVINLSNGVYVLTRTGINEDSGVTGDLDVSRNVTIQGAGSGTTIIDGGGIDRVFDLKSSAIVTMQDLTVRNGAIGNRWGGGINLQTGSSLNLNRVVVSGNTGDSGGGIYNYRATVTAVDTTISGNSGKWGGGFYNDGGTATLERVTVSGNMATIEGAGIYNVTVGATMSLTNVTVSGNTTIGNGGGLYTKRAVTITNSTIVNNTAASGGGLYIANPGTATLKNTIVASNIGDNSNASVISLGNNLDSANSLGLTQPGDLINTEPLLNALEQNGGYTATHALRIGSLAIDAGATSGAPLVDQQGVARDANPDIGAVEFVAAVSNPPVAANDAYAVNEDGVLTLAASGVLSNDTDMDGDLLTAHLVSGPANGTLNLNLDGSLTYTPNANFNGTDTFTYRVSDGYQYSSSATVTLTVNAVNDLPTITSNGGGATAAVNVTENSTAVTTVTATDPEVPGQTLTYSILGGADAARFAINSTTGVLTFVSAPDYEVPTDSGADRVYDVIVKVSDGLLTDSQAISVTVTPVNDNAPVITNNGGGNTATISIAENTTAVTTVTATDADLPAQTLTYSILGGTDAARFAINGSTGVLTFVSAPDYEVPTDSGADRIYNVIVQVSDGLLADSQAISVTVTPVNDNSPVITSNGGGNSATISVAEGVTAVTAVTASDLDVPLQTLTYSISGGADASLFVINGTTGALSFVAIPDFESPDANNRYRVNVTVTDGTSTDTQSITVDVTNVNERPIAQAESYVINEDSILSVNHSGVLANDSDPDNDPLAPILIGDVINGILTLNADGSFSYRPNTNFHGSDSFTYRASDGSLTSNPVTVSITVLPINDAPVLQNYSGVTDRGVELSGPSLLAGAVDAEGDPMTIFLVNGPGNGTVTLRLDGTFSYIPDSDYFGVDTFQFAASDGMDVGTTKTATIVVRPPFNNAGLGSTPTNSNNGSDENGSSSNSGTSESPSYGNSDGPTAGNDSQNEGPADQPTTTPPTRSNGEGSMSNLVNTVAAPGRQSEDAESGEVHPGFFQQFYFRTDLAPESASRMVKSEFRADGDSDRTNSKGLADGFSSQRLSRLLSSDNRGISASQREFLYQTLIAQNIESVNEFEQETRRTFSLNDQVVGSVEVVTTVSSVGYLIWNAVRGGMLLSTLIAQVPAWNLVDPMLVIDGDEKEDDKESLQNIVDQQQKKLKHRKAKAAD